MPGIAHLLLIPGWRVIYDRPLLASDQFLSAATTVAVTASERGEFWERETQIIEAVPTRFQVLFTTVALTGLRLGELLALLWKHVDFENCRLRIQQSLWDGEIVPVKTRSSVRVILFGEVLARHMTDHLQRSVHIGPEDFVFAHDSGGPLNPDVLRGDVLYPALDRSGIPRPKRASGFHTFRQEAS